MQKRPLEARQPGRRQPGTDMTDRGPQEVRLGVDRWHKLTQRRPTPDDALVSAAVRYPRRAGELRAIEAASGVAGAQRAGVPGDDAK